MTHSRSRRWPVAVVLAAALLSGCDDGSSTSADPTDPTGTAPATSPTTSESVSASPTVTPNDGPLLANPTVELRAPAGWKKQKAVVRTEASATYYGQHDDSNGLISLGWQMDWDSDATLDQLAKNVRHTFGSTFDIERGPDVEIAGDPAYHFTGTASGGLQLFDSFGTHRDGRFVFIDFYVGKDTSEAERQEIIDGTLASVRWKG